MKKQRKAKKGLNRKGVHKKKRMNPKGTNSGQSSVSRRPKAESLGKQNVNVQLPLIKLPLYEYLNGSEYWYGLIPELICIQGNWIQGHITKLNLPANLAPYLKNAISQHHTALMIAGNDLAYFSLYGLRAILERIAMGWTAHSQTALDANDVVARLSDNDMDIRKSATQDFMDLARRSDSVHKMIYDMVSQYFAHASKMDGITFQVDTEKDQMLRMRMRVLPLLLLLDVGNRLVTLICALLDDQEISYVSPHGGKLEGKFDIDVYVRGCAYVMCEKHSPKRGVQMATLIKNISDIRGEIGLTTIYRGGMEVHRYGKPEDKPDPGQIADFCWYGIGKGHDEKVKVKCVEESSTGERYELSWPKHLELDSSGVAAIAQQGRGNAEFFDYISAFLRLLEER